MKINDKNLAAFASSSSQVDREGYLMKKGESSSSSSSSSSKNFSKRWFVLKGNLLFYFDKKVDRDPVGVIILEGSTIELAESEGEQHFCFKVTFPTKSYVLSADSQASMELWMKSLACASYDYVKLMADELQRQLDELCKSDSNSTTSGDANRNTAAGPTPTPPPRIKSSIKGANQAPRPRKTFAALHAEFGAKIVQDSKSRWDENVKTTTTTRVTPNVNIPLSSPPPSQQHQDLMNF